MDSTKKLRHLLFWSLFLIIVISSLNFWAIRGFFYYIYWWFDIIMHFLGGVWISITFLWAYITFLSYSDQLLTDFNRKKLFLLTITAFFIVGVSWEIFEIFIGIEVEDPKYIFDTINDLVVGVLGATFSYQYVVFIYLRKLKWQKVLN